MQYALVLRVSVEDFYIAENEFRVWTPDLMLAEGPEDAYNSRQLFGIMSTERTDRQDEKVIAKGLDFQDFLTHGHFNDNHSQETSAIIGYPEEVKQYENLGVVKGELDGIAGWACKGYVLKGYKRADDIWELAKALAAVPNRKLGFSIEGKVIRRSNKCIEKARIRNVAITNCPVNTDATWNVLTKSFYDSDVAMKALSAGVGTTPATQTGGGALRTEDLDSRFKKKGSMIDPKKREGGQTEISLEDALKRALGWNDLMKAMEQVQWSRPDFSDDAIALFVKHLLKRELMNERGQSKAG